MKKTKANAERPTPKAFASRLPNAESRTKDAANGISKPGAVISSRDDFRALVDNIVEAQLDKEKLEGQRDSRILKITDEYKDRIDALAEELKESTARAEQYAIEHKDELLTGEAKSADTGSATFGFRMGRPALALLNEKWTWEKVIDAIKKRFRPMASILIVVKEEPNKNAIKSQLGEKDLAKIGTRLDQQDKFFIDPKRDPADPRRLVAAPAK